MLKPLAKLREDKATSHRVRLRNRASEAVYSPRRREMPLNALELRISFHVVPWPGIVRQDLVSTRCG